MTDYYEAADKEEQQGINIVEAAKATKLKHLVMWYVVRKSKKRRVVS